MPSIKLLHAAVQARPLTAIRPASILATRTDAQEMSEWPLSFAARHARQLLQAPLFAALGLLAPSRVTGLESLAAVDGPVLFAANHTSHLDTPLLLSALPGKKRHRLTIAAAADYFFSKPFVGAAVALGFNAFPFERASCSKVRATLTQCSGLVDRGWSILLYPEGTRSIDGAIGSFKPGLGLLAASLGVPVVPVYIGGLFAVMPKGQHVPHRGAASVHFGEPLLFSSGAHYRDVAQSVEDAVRALASDHAQEERQHAYSYSEK